MTRNALVLGERKWGFGILIPSLPGIGDTNALAHFKNSPFRKMHLFHLTSLLSRVLSCRSARWRWVLSFVSQWFYTCTETHIAKKDTFLLFLCNLVVDVDTNICMAIAENLIWRVYLALITATALELLTFRGCHAIVSSWMAFTWRNGNMAFGRQRQRKRGGKQESMELCFKHHRGQTTYHLDIASWKPLSPPTLLANGNNELSANPTKQFATNQLLRYIWRDWRL